MYRIFLTFILAFLATSVGTAVAQTAIYQPLQVYLDVNPLVRWESQRRAYETAKGQHHPSLPGLRPRNVELLEDLFLRKHPSLRGSLPAARQRILDWSKSNPNGLRGFMAEALFVDRNPQWSLVQNPNASQHDVTLWDSSRGIRFNGQIKFHQNGNPAVYARDMRGDFRAHRFFIPDDHVEAVKAYFRQRAEAHTAAGNSQEAKRAWRDYGRVRPCGYDSSEITHSTGRAAESLLAETNARYTCIGAAVALSLGPIAWDWATGDLPSNQAAYRATRALSLFGVGVGTDLILANVRQGALRGTVRGNVIVGTALAITEVAWLLYEHGWRDAFYQPEFYNEIVGGIGGITLGITGFAVGTSLASETGMWAPVIGTGVGIVTGTVGYLGGRSASRAMLEMTWPELLQRQERTRFAAVHEMIEEDIKAAMVVSRP